MTLGHSYKMFFNRSCLRDGLVGNVLPSNRCGLGSNPGTGQYAVRFVQKERKKKERMPMTIKLEVCQVDTETQLNRLKNGLTFATKIIESLLSLLNIRNPISHYKFKHVL